MNFDKNRKNWNTFVMQKRANSIQVRKTRTF
jgi:hypothetical protein